MFPSEIFQATILKLTSILESLNIRYHLTGGVTSTVYGEPRMTQDIDIVIDPVSTQLQLDSFVEALKDSDFLFSEATMRGEVSRQGLFQLLDRKESLKLDIYPRELIPGELSRSEPIEFFPGIRLLCVSCMDAALSKLIWISKGSHKSRRDFRAIWRNANESLREATLRLASEMKLAELAFEVLAEPDELR